MGPDDIVPGSTRRPKLLLDRAVSFVARYNSRLVWFLVCFGCLGTFAALPFVPTHLIGTDEKALIIGSLGSQFDLVVNGTRRAVHVARQLISSKHGTLHGEGVGLDVLVARADALMRNEESDETMDAIHVGELLGWHSSSGGWSSGVDAPPASPCAGTWTYTRIHGGRGDGTESLLLMFVIDEATKPSETALTIALAIESTLLLRSAPWLAKDIYIAIVQARSECSRSQATREWLSSSSLGLPQQGLVIELESTTVSEVYLDVIGYNGQLPNLDMVALTTKNAEIFSHLAFRGERTVSYATVLFNNLQSISRLANPILNRAGAHAVLLQNSIDALTLHFTGPRHEEKDRGVAGATSQTLLEMEILTARQVLFIAEMVMRSCNNLQERLHHASSLYFLVGQRKAVSIGIYLLIPGSLLIALLVQWTALQQRKSNEAPVKPFRILRTTVLLLLMLALLLVVCGGWWVGVTAEEPLGGLKSMRMVIKALRAKDFNNTLMLVAVSIIGIWRSGASWCAFVLEVTPHKEENGEERTNCSQECSRTRIKFFLCSVLFVISAGLLLLRWASCTFLLLVAVPLLQIL